MRLLAIIIASAGCLAILGSIAVFFLAEHPLQALPVLIFGIASLVAAAIAYVVSRVLAA